MKRPFLILTLILFAVVLWGCSKFEVRPDPAPSPLDTGFHSLLLEGCGTFGSGQLGCSFDSAAEVSPEDKVTVHSPLGGVLSVTGSECGVDEKVFLPVGGAHALKLQNWIRPSFQQPFCIVDLYLAWQLPEDVESPLPIRGLRGRVYLRMREGSHPSTMRWNNGIVQKGAGTLKVREKPALRPEARLAFEPNLLTVEFEHETERGAFRLYGCGLGIKEGRFSGNQISLSLPKLLGESYAPQECLMFGWAIDKEGRMDEDFVLGLTIFSEATEKLAASAEIIDGEVCYEAERFVTLAVIGERYSNKLKDCLKIEDEEFISFYTVKGRALHGKIKEGKIQWIP